MSRKNKRNSRNKTVATNEHEFESDDWQPEPADIDAHAIIEEFKRDANGREIVAAEPEPAHSQFGFSSLESEQAPDSEGRFSLSCGANGSRTQDDEIQTDDEFEADATHNRLSSEIDEGCSIDQTLNNLEQRLDHSERLVRLLTEKLDMTSSDLGRLRKRTSRQLEDKAQSETLLKEQRQLRSLFAEFTEQWADRYEGHLLQQITDQLTDIQNDLTRRPADLKSVGLIAEDVATADHEPFSLSPSGSVSAEISSGNISIEEYLTEYKAAREVEEELKAEAEQQAKSKADEGGHDSTEQAVVSDDDVLDADELTLVDQMTIVVLDAATARQSQSDPESKHVEIDQDEQQTDFESLVACFSRLTAAEEVEEFNQQDALAVRDQCIELLCKQQRQIVAHFNQSIAMLSNDWSARHAESDSDSVRELETLRALVNEQLRVGEISISLERATVSRERLLLESQRRELDRKSDRGNERGDEQCRVKRRWIKFLGK